MVINMYDVIIIGLGPAGAAAAVYCQRAGIRSVVFEGFAPGGQVSTTDKIENYPGFVSVEGYELAMKLADQAKHCGAEIRYEQILSADLGGEIKRVSTAKGSYQARAAIICGGAKRRTLGVAGEDRLVGRGLSYCAVCDGGFYRGKRVAVIGGGDTAVGDAVYLSRLCEKVYIIHRRDSFRAAKSKLRQLEACANVEKIMGAVVDSFRLDADGRINGIILKRGDSLVPLDCDGVFAAVGTVPDTSIYQGLELDGNGYIITDENMRTSLPNVFAAGDIRRKPVRQIVTAASDGAIAGISAAEAIEQLNNE